MEDNKGIKVIDEFLALWRVRAKQYYDDLRVKYEIASKVKHEITEENLKYLKVFTWSKERKFSDEKVAEIMRELPKKAGYIVEHLKSDIDHQRFEQWKRTYGKGEMELVSRYDYDELIEKHLDREVESKKKTLIARITKKAGEVLDAGRLCIGVNGEINGVVVGEKGTVRVQTIYAGGHNIQCLHYRVLVN